MSDLPAPFTTLAAPHRFDAVTLNSEFLAFAERADTPEDALAQLAALRGATPTPRTTAGPTASALPTASATTVSRVARRGRRSCGPSRDRA
ncbi:hypothetical protein HNQ10_001334 [Deinococcus metallilatus]|uniref:Uncharacterized protein n=1 Tax=Deinococcus metallilatus TaxID=1211322 RepID=A0ABR6MT32_9DEIO|nr:hypothetical protein [Deinococcus metallilatus]